MLPRRPAVAYASDRFSPYFESPEAFGLSRPEPIRAYRHVFPFGNEELARLAYYFSFNDSESSTGNMPQGQTPDYVQPTLSALENWRRLAGTVTLRGQDREQDLLILFDTRPVARSFEHRLRGWARTLYCYCDTARRLPQIVERFRTEDGAVDESVISRKLSEWVDANIMICIENAYLSLALIGESSTFRRTEVDAGLTMPNGITCETTRSEFSSR